MSAIRAVARSTIIEIAIEPVPHAGDILGLGIFPDVLRCYFTAAYASCDDDGREKLSGMSVSGRVSGRVQLRSGKASKRRATWALGRPETLLSRDAPAWLLDAVALARAEITRLESG